MKKVLLGLLAVGMLSVTACKKEAKVETEAKEVANDAEAIVDSADKTVSNTASNVSSAAKSLLDNAPSFGVPEADKFVSDVKNYVNEAATNPEAAKTKSVELGKNMAAALTKLSPDQKKQLLDWYQQVGTALSSK